ncbi:hypothetical protein SRABI112_01143 [Pseudomonas mediterranea]|nr:hypothetical protein SRABI112_01143 [Pseudomonas mediterranea]
MFLILAGDVAETQRTGIELELAGIRGDESAVELRVVFGTNIDVVLPSNAGLLLNPFGRASSLAVADRATYTCTRPYGYRHTDVELLAFDLARIRYRRNVKVAAYPTDNLIPAQVCTCNIRIFSAGEAQSVAGVQVGLLLPRSFTLQVASAQVDAGVDANAF